MNLRNLKQKIKKIDDKLDKDSTKIADITRECEKSQNLIPQLEEGIPKLQKLLVDEEKILEEIKENSRAETEVFRGELADVCAELEPWEKQLIGSRGKLEVSITEKNLLNEKHGAGRAAYEEAQKQISELQKSISTKSSIVKTIQNELERYKLEESEAHKIEKAGIKEQESLIPLEQTARLKVADLLSTMESEKNHGSVLKAILQAKESNHVHGIYGRMGDLGAIDAKYDVAISTACPGLDYIVVETAAAAQACVERVIRPQRKQLHTWKWN